MCDLIWDNSGTSTSPSGPRNCSNFNLYPIVPPIQVVPELSNETRAGTCLTLPSWMSSTDKIYSGKNAPFPIPWQVSLRRCLLDGNPHKCDEYFEHYCGGTILDSKTILTAAHCTDDYHHDYSLDYVMAGSTNLKGGQNIRIAKVIN